MLATVATKRGEGGRGKRERERGKGRENTGRGSTNRVTEHSAKGKRGINSPRCNIIFLALIISPSGVVLHPTESDFAILGQGHPPSLPSPHSRKHHLPLSHIRNEKRVLMEEF